MNKFYLLLIFLPWLVCSYAQQTTDALIEQVVKLTPRSLPKYDTRPKQNVFFLQTGFNDAIYKDVKSLQALKGKVITKVELIYTTYRKSETFDQHGLNRKRLRSLIAAAPQLLTQPAIEWVLFAQSGCTTAEMGKDFYHGVAITYREPESVALRDAELEFLKAVADGSVPAYAYDAFIKNTLKPDTAVVTPSAEPPKIKMPDFIGGERARIDFFYPKYQNTYNCC